jgi:hypothetical protein
LHKLTNLTNPNKTNLQNTPESSRILQKKSIQNHQLPKNTQFPPTINRNQSKQEKDKKLQVARKNHQKKQKDTFSSTLFVLFRNRAVAATQRLAASPNAIGSRKLRDFEIRRIREEQNNVSEIRRSVDFWL